MAVVPVVAHDEIAVWRNDDRPEIIPRTHHDVRIVVIAVGIVHGLIVDIDFLVDYLNLMKRQPYYSFDVILLAVVWVPEHDNIKSSGRFDRDNLFVDNREPNAVNELVDKDMVPDK